MAVKEYRERESTVLTAYRGQLLPDVSNISIIMGRGKMDGTLQLTIMICSYICISL